MHRLPQAREKLGLGTLDGREPTREFLPEDSPIESGSSQRLEAVPHQVQGVGEAVSVRVDQIVDRVDVHFVEDLQANRSKAVLGTNVVPNARHHQRARGVSEILLRIPHVPDLRLKDLPGDLEECLGSHVFDPANLCLDLRDVIAHGLPREAKVVIVEEALRVLSEVCDESPDHLDVIWLHVARTRLTLAQMSRVDLHRFHLHRGNSSSGHRESYRGGIGTIAFPAGPRNVSLDVGLRHQIEAESGMPVATSGNVSLFGLHLTDLPIVAPPPTRSALFPDNWAYVRADLLIAMNATQGGPVQAILAEAPLDPAVVASLRLTRLETLGAIGFVRGSIAEVQSSLRLLALIIAAVIGLLVYAAMSLEVHSRARGIATLRRPGASSATVAGVYEAQAVVLALSGAILGSALGIVAAHAVVSFAPVLGLPNLVILSPPAAAVVLALLISVMAAVLAGLVPSRRAAVLVRTKGAVSF